MPDLIKQADLEEMYDTFRERPEATDREVAIRLARFAEVKIYGQAERAKKKDDGGVPDLGIFVGIMIVSIATGAMMRSGGAGWLVFGACLLTWGMLVRAASYARK